MVIYFEMFSSGTPNFHTFYYETITQTGITCTKIPRYMRDSARWFIVKKTKIF